MNEGMGHEGGTNQSRFVRHRRLPSRHVPYGTKRQ